MRRSISQWLSAMPTKVERAWMDEITRLGCIVCLLQRYGFVPPAVHHLLDEGGRRIGHLFSIPLCQPGHHKDAPKSSGEISRHPNKARFEERYGTEESLLEKTREMIGWKAKSFCLFGFSHQRRLPEHIAKPRDDSN